MTSDLEPAEAPSAERVEHAATIIARLGEVDQLDGWCATFRRDNLECTGVWPADSVDLYLSDFEVPIERWHADPADLSSCYERHRERARLAVRQGIERADLERRLLREAVS